MLLCLRVCGALKLASRQHLSVVSSLWTPAAVVVRHCRMLLRPCQWSNGLLVPVHSFQHNSRGPLSRLARLLLPCRGQDRLLAHFQTALQQLLHSPLLPAAERAQLEEAHSEAALDLMPLAQAAHLLVQGCCKGGAPGDTRYRWTASTSNRDAGLCLTSHAHTLFRQGVRANRAVHAKQGQEAVP